MKKYLVSNIEVEDCLNGIIEEELNERAKEGYRLIEVIGPNSAIFEKSGKITAYQLIFEKEI